MEFEVQDIDQGSAPVKDRERKQDWAEEEVQLSVVLPSLGPPTGKLWTEYCQSVSQVRPEWLGFRPTLS